MGLLDDMKNEQIIKGPPCSVSLAIASMSKSDLDDFNKACADPAIAGTVICRVLARRGVVIRPEALRRHRKKECRCG